MLIIKNTTLGIVHVLAASLALAGCATGAAGNDSEGIDDEPTAEAASALTPNANGSPCTPAVDGATCKKWVISESMSGLTGNSNDCVINRVYTVKEKGTNIWFTMDFTSVAKYFYSTHGVAAYRVNATINPALSAACTLGVGSSGLTKDTTSGVWTFPNPNFLPAQTVASVPCDAPFGVTLSPLGQSTLLPAPKKFPTPADYVGFQFTSPVAVTLTGMNSCSLSYLRNDMFFAKASPGAAVSITVSGLGQYTY